MYLDVLPICKNKDQYKVGLSDGQIIDYCVRMKRMDESRQMDKLLVKKQVNKLHVRKIALQLVQFHTQAKIAYEGEDWKELFDEFADIRKSSEFVEQTYGSEEKMTIMNSIQVVYNFLFNHVAALENRNKNGYIIEGHGDLHTKNIFLLSEPVIFDCIEFNKDFRILDILSEIAFLVMDLERFDRKDLADYFFNEYFTMMPVIEDENDLEIFNFYKLHRANVMMKIQALRAMDCNDEAELLMTKQNFHSYFRLFKRYLHKLENH